MQPETRREVGAAVSGWRGGGLEKRRAMEKKGRLEKVGLRVAVWREEGEGFGESW